MSVLDGAHRAGFGEHAVIAPIPPTWDVCIAYGPRPYELRSLRYLNGWLDEDRAALERFGCGVAPGHEIGVEAAPASPASDDD